MKATGTRLAIVRRRSSETEVLVRLRLDRDPALSREEAVESRTGIGFLDHLVQALAYHAGWGLELSCAGDLEVDDHHSAEDCALALGEAFSLALGRGAPPIRFGSAYAPLDEALVRAVVDISGRPGAFVALGLSAARLGGLAGENASHFLSSFAAAARITLHVDAVRGENAHHVAEAAFKALALALREAASVRPAPAGIPASSAGGTPSTKGGVILEELGEAAFDAAFAAAAPVPPAAAAGAAVPAGKAR